MSYSPKCIPAFELLQARYHPEKAEEIYRSMSEEEREKTKYIMNSLACRKEAMQDSINIVAQSLPSQQIIENCTITENVTQYFRHLGYSVQSYNISPIATENYPVLVLYW